MRMRRSNSRDSSSLRNCLAERSKIPTRTDFGRLASRRVCFFCGYEKGGCGWFDRGRCGGGVLGALASEQPVVFGVMDAASTRRKNSTRRLARVGRQAEAGGGEAGGTSASAARPGRGARQAGEMDLVCLRTGRFFRRCPRPQLGHQFTQRRPAHKIKLDGLHLSAIGPLALIQHQ